MAEQLSLFEDPHAKEKEYQDYIKDALNGILNDNYLKNDVIRYRYNKSGYWSLLFKKDGMKQETVVFQYRFGPKSQYVSFPWRSKDLIPSNLGKRRKLEGYYTKVYLNSAEEARDLKEAVAQSLNETIEASPLEYSCCSRYQECGNAEHCVNPYKEIASECRYRINLKHGRNFYKKQV